jgi:hypothetical protein
MFRRFRSETFGAVATASYFRVDSRSRLGERAVSICDRYELFDSDRYFDDDNVQHHIGSFKTELEAAWAYNKAVSTLKRTGSRRKLNAVDADGNLLPKPAASSIYHGVCRYNWYKSASYNGKTQPVKWQAAVRLSKKLGFEGQMRNMGHFDEELDAARAVDTFYRTHMPSIAASKVNFPTKTELAACARS